MALSEEEWVGCPRNDVGGGEVEGNGGDGKREFREQT